MDHTFTDQELARALALIAMAETDFCQRFLFSATSLPEEPQSPFELIIFFMTDAGLIFQLLI